MSWTRAYRKATVSCIVRAGGEVDATPADLLIPGPLFAFAHELRKAHGEWRDLILYLVDRHRARVLHSAGGMTHRRFRYQAAGQKLRRICYLPYSEGHAELRMLSYAARVSMCALVVQMLIWEMEAESCAELDDLRGVPISFQSGWTLWGQELTVSAWIQMPAGTSIRPPPGKTISARARQRGQDVFPSYHA